MEKNKVVIIGIDGGTFDIIGPMIERGELPRLAALVRSGARSDLQSTVPPITAPAWTSFMTGTAPGKHGIFNFVGDTHRTYGGRVLSAADSRSPTLWSLLGRAGKRLTLLNIPFTYPPEQVNGIMISGMGAPGEGEDIALPRDVYRDLVKEVGPYTVDLPVGDIFRDREGVQARADGLISGLHAMEARRTDAALHLLSRYEWDLFMIVYVMTDRLQHLFWRFMDATHPGYDAELAQRYGTAIADGYRAVDRELGRVLDACGGGATVIVMSDHGFGPLHRCFYINSWLVQNGLLRLKRTLPWKFQRTAVPLRRVLDKLRLGAAAAMLPESVLDRGIPVIRRSGKKWHELVDWSRTRAYAADPLGISINLRGREPGGSVRQADYESVVRDIREKLLQLTDPVTGGRVVDSVTHSSEAYSGPASGDAPDLLISLQGLSCLPYPQRFTAGNLFEPPQNEWSGTHRFNGIFIMNGPGIRPGADLTGARIIDIAPTVLHLFRQPVPADMDGRVIADAFSDRDLEAHPVVYATSPGQEKHAGEALSDGDEQKVRTHLESLGYL